MERKAAVTDAAFSARAFKERVDALQGQWKDELQRLAELHHRKDDQRRADEAHQGQHGIENEQIDREADQRHRLSERR